MLDNKYDHKKVEEGAYDSWVKEGYFTAGDVSKKPYCIVIPPPNVTGKLHLGHAWDTTLQDMIIRYKRMCGYDVLWLPGMDHAAISTEVKVVERLKEQGINKRDLGREGFLQQAWNWKEEYATIIREQWGKLGLSLDYTRERFTLDEGLNQAVTRVFVDYYNKGLIYRGERIINWDPIQQTALSNEEVIYQDDEGAFYHLKYWLEDKSMYLEVATTRPETLFGDTAVAVNPDDERYNHLVGKNVILPIVNKLIPIVADEHADPEFGTGVVKITPAHDPNDFEVGNRHNLERVVCMNPDATMNENAGKYCGMSREECREALVEDLKNEDLLLEIEPMVHSVGHSERTGCVIEPYLSKQWFVKMRPLAEQVLEYQADPQKKVNFVPERFEKTLTHWMESCYDWCISRQLWWGHRIPAWYKGDEVYVGLTAPEGEGWVQDEDVLDTWFSSALWPFSTLGWPNETDDFKRYYPNDCLVTGYDIIFFWVSRMVFQGEELTGSRPFKDVLIHGLIRDAQGRKMSKSLGNGVDPMDVIDQYGADALRFFLTTNSAPGMDLRYIPEKVEAAWNFINKIWNAARFVQMNTEGFTLEDIDLTHLNNIDTWMLDKLNKTIESVDRNMDKYEFGMVGNELYNFIWNDFCNWYIELSKSTLNSENPEVKKATQSTLLVVLMDIIKLLHPFMPFVTEKIYADIPHEAAALCVDSWPTVREINTDSCQEVELMISIISTIRQLRVDYNVKPSLLIDITVLNSDNQIISIDLENNNMLNKVAKVNCVTIKADDAIVRPINNGSIAVDAAQIIDYQAELAKLNKEKGRLENEIKRSNGMLSNQNFVAKAPAAKIEAEREKLANYQNQYNVVIAQIEEISTKTAK